MKKGLNPKIKPRTQSKGSTNRSIKRNIAHSGPARDVRLFKAWMGGSFRNAERVWPKPPLEIWEQLAQERQRAS